MQEITRKLTNNEIVMRLKISLLARNLFEEF